MHVPTAIVFCHQKMFLSISDFSYVRLISYATEEQD